MFFFSTLTINITTTNIIWRISEKKDKIKSALRAIFSDTKLYIAIYSDIFTMLVLLNQKKVTTLSYQ